MDVYVVVHFATTFDDSAVYVPRDAGELLALSWCTVDAHTLELSPPQEILVKPANTPVTPECVSRYGITWDDVKDARPLKDAVAHFDQTLAAELKDKDFTFVTADIHTLRVSLPREARDKSVVLPVCLQHPRVFDLYNEYSKWQTTHPEAMGYPSSSLANLVTALDVEVPEGWTEDASDDKRSAVTVHARVLAQLAHKSLPVDAHQAVLTKPYDSSLDAKIFLAERSKILYLSNLPPETTQPELESWFAHHGGRPIAFWTLKNPDSDPKPPSARAKGASGFAVFSKHEDAAESLFLNGRMLMDRIVEVQASSTRVLDRASELLTPFPPSKNRPRPGDWTCPSCGFSNFQRRIACFRCSFPATSAVAIQEQMYTGSPSHDSGSGNNRRKDDKGGYGAYQDHYHGMKNGNGYSGSYGHGYNHNNQRGHYGNSVPFRAGDWKCPNESCQYHNFAKNLCCLKCGASKPTGVGNQMQNNSNNNGAGLGSIHSVNSTAAAIAAATASGQPLNLNNSYMGLHQPLPHHSRGSDGSLGTQSASSSPIHNGGMYSQLQNPYQAKPGSAPMAQSASQLPQHLALLQSQNHGGRSKNSQSSSSSPGVYAQSYGYKGSRDGYSRDGYSKDFGSKDFGSKDYGHKDYGSRDGFGSRDGHGSRDGMARDGYRDGYGSREFDGAYGMNSLAGKMNTMSLNNAS